MFEVRRFASNLNNPMASPKQLSDLELCMAVAEYVLDDPNFVADYVHDTAARHTVLRRLREKGFGELTGTGRQICELALALTGPALFQTAVDASIAESSEAA